MERKLAAIMFTDIAGFTALSKSLKSELKNEFQNRYFPKMIIEEYNKVFK